jgi:drug/metabolite transporter (DMT)-like permease
MAERALPPANDQEQAPTWALVLAFAGIYVIWGSTYLAIRFAVETLPPFLMGAARFLTAGALLYGWARLRGASAPEPAHWRGSLILGALLLAGGNGVVVYAEQWVPSGLAALLVTAVPLWVVVLEWVGPKAVRKGRPGPAVLAGVAGGLAGVALLVGPGDLEGTIDLLGAVTLLAAALSWAFGSVISSRLPRPSSPTLGTAMQMLAGGAVLLVVGVAWGELAAVQLAAMSAKSLLALAYLVVFGSLLAFTAYVYLLRHVATSKVATYAYVNPVVALLLGNVLAGEELTPRTWLAATVILASVVLITTYRRGSRVRPAGENPVSAPEPAGEEKPATGAGSRPAA